MIRRRDAIAILAASIALLPIEASAQAIRGKVKRIVGFLSPRGSDAFDYLESFKSGMSALGYRYGTDYAIESRYGDSDYNKLPVLAQELAELPVDVILAHASPAIRASQAATRTIPIVMALTGDPVASGFVASLSRPGGNITGLSLLSPDLTGKHLEMLMSWRKEFSLAGALLNNGSSTYPALKVAIEQAAEKAKVQVMLAEISRADQIVGALDRLNAAGIQGLLIPPDALLVGQVQWIAALCIERKMPSIMDFREFVDNGGLMSYGPSIKDNYRRSAAYVQKIFDGANPALLPVEQPTAFELAINLRSAKAIGLSVPANLHAIANDVVE
jgi:putative ABC transport system substrate-binding protein